MFELILFFLPFVLFLLLPRPARAQDREACLQGEISLQEVCPVRIGQAENTQAGTGCTVFVCPEGMTAGLDVRGGGPASREPMLLHPLMAAQSIHAIVLSGGSAFSLGAADGVMQLLEERGIGLDVGVTRVPLVVQSDIFDLTVGDSRVRPDARMAREAARCALDAPNYRDGNYGVGCGATAGKAAGMETCMKTGIGSYAIQIGDLRIGAAVVVNCYGDVYDWHSGSQIAGLLTPDRRGLRSTTQFLSETIQVRENKFVGNTTLAVVLTNAAFNKTQLCKIAGMAHDGMARAIRPVHTSVDGDSIYAVSAGSVQADQDLVGSLCADVLSEAILRSVTSARSAYGFPAYSDLF